MDQITIKDLEVYANHGLYKEEKALGQKFLVSAILSLDTKLAGVSDQMDYSVDYGKVCHRIKEILTENDFNLIECVAETVAKKLLLEFSLIRKLEIEVKKPWAPIGLPLDYVSVKIKRGWHRAYLGVGSNMGDRMEYINQAINAIEVQDDTRVVHVSSLIETKPYGGVVQDDFLNGCIAIDTLKEPEELLDFLMDVEAQAAVDADGPNVSVIPAGTFAAVTHTGPYENIKYAYDALCGWVAHHPEYKVCGPAVPFPVSWTVKMKKKQKETQDILSYHTQAAGCSDKARAKASGGRQPIEECGRTGL